MLSPTSAPPSGTCFPNIQRHLTEPVWTVKNKPEPVISYYINHIGPIKLEPLIAKPEQEGILNSKDLSYHDISKRVRKIRLFSCLPWNLFPLKKTQALHHTCNRTQLHHEFLQSNENMQQNYWNLRQTSVQFTMKTQKHQRSFQLCSWWCSVCVVKIIDAHLSASSLYQSSIRNR